MDFYADKGFPKAPAIGQYATVAMFASDRWNGWVGMCNSVAFEQCRLCQMRQRVDNQSNSTRLDVLIAAVVNADRIEYGLGKGHG